MKHLHLLLFFVSLCLLPPSSFASSEKKDCESRLSAPMDRSRVQRIQGRLDLWDRMQMRDFNPSEIETLEQALQILQAGKSLEDELLSELIHLEAQSESLTVSEKKPSEGNLQDPGVPKEMQFREPFWSEFPF